MFVLFVNKMCKSIWERSFQVMCSHVSRKLLNKPRNQQYRYNSPRGITCTSTEKALQLHTLSLQHSLLFSQTTDSFLERVPGVGLRGWRLMVLPRELPREWLLFPNLVR